MIIWPTEIELDYMHLILNEKALIDYNKAIAIEDLNRL